MFSTHRRSGPGRHEPADVRSWPLITANGLGAIALAAATFLMIWGCTHVRPGVVLHGRLVAGNVSGRSFALAGLILGGVAFLVYAGGFIGYSLCLYGKKFPLEIEVGEIHEEVGEIRGAVCEGLGRIEAGLADGAVAAEVKRRGAQHRKRHLKSV